MKGKDDPRPLLDRYAMPQRTHLVAADADKQNSLLVAPLPVIDNELDEDLLNIDCEDEDAKEEEQDFQKKRVEIEREQQTEATQQKKVLPLVISYHASYSPATNKQIKALWQLMDQA